MTDISVIVPTFNREAILPRTLASLRLASKAVSSEIIVVNDSKTTRVQGVGDGIRVLDNPGTGAASARNLGARDARGGLLIFVDDDMIVSEENLRRTLELHSRFPASCFNPDWKYSDEIMRQLDESPFGRFLLASGLTHYRGWVPGLPWKPDAVFEVPRLAAFYLSIERSVFESVGGFDESFANQGVEDDEFSTRLRSHRIRLYIDSTQAIYHDEVDRLNLRAKLSRSKTGAFNKRHALERGMPEHRIDYSPAKRLLWSALSPLKLPLLALCEGWPNHRALDPVYRGLARALTGTVIFEGYVGRDSRPV